MKRRSPEESTSSFSRCGRAPVRPRSRKEHFAGFPTARKFRSPHSAAVTPRFSTRPPCSAQAHRVGAGRAAATFREGRGEPIREFISGWCGRHFVRRRINRHWGRPFTRFILLRLVAELSLSCLTSRLPETFPRGSCLPERPGVEPSYSEETAAASAVRAGPPRALVCRREVAGPGPTLQSHELRSSASRCGGHDLPQGGQPDLPYLA